MMDAESLKKWFAGFREFSDDLGQRRAEADIKRIRKLIADFRPVQRNLEEERRCYTPEYNVFSVLHIAHNEVFGHSAFLADLLDIRGHHQQGRLFYDEFINQLELQDRKKKFEVSEDIFFTVYREFFFRTESEGAKNFKDNRIDILIHYDSPERQFGIAIENKIFAPDQSAQLKRYTEYMHERYGADYLLLYLTPDGKPPSDYSRFRDEYTELKAKRLMKLISYQQHINSLLNNTITKIRSEKVASIASQYLQTIKNNFRNDIS